MSTPTIERGHPHFLCDGRKVCQRRVGNGISTLTIYRVLGLEEMRARLQAAPQQPEKAGLRDLMREDGP